MAFVHYKSWNETYMSMLGEDYLKARTYDSQVEKTIKSYNDGKAVGFITYGIYKNEESIKGEIFALYVLKDYQHKKIGYELMTRALNELSEALLKKIYSKYPNAEYLHFSDIDAGGFWIYQTLKEKTGIPFVPYRMNEEELISNKNNLKKLTENDKKRLNKMLLDNRFEVFKDTIKYMLVNNVKLEQEILD